MKFEFSIEELERVAKAKGWDYEITHSTFRVHFGFSYGRGNWHWFRSWNDETKGFTFDHSYSQINGSTKRGLNQEWAVRERLTKELEKLNK